MNYYDSKNVMSNPSVYVSLDFLEVLESGNIYNSSVECKEIVTLTVVILQERLFGAHISSLYCF